ncbi:predicted protein [Nematostella vectensis]|uniref:CHAT domain-containing protein n=1 Tax=Nematostella vectensis TaxID=45351 RepID=A7SWV3_NEMVE|nr:predicted protein [Nematostella vectensis]|eukprot:XP_001623916.1 predicted protein [Nematostella vectensis]
MNNYQHALSLFQKTGGESGQAKAYLGMGNVHWFQGKYEDAMNNYQHALSLFQKTGGESGQAKAYLGMGNVHWFQGKYEDAMNNYQHALSLFQKTGDECGQAKAYLGMGNVHMSQAKYEDAMNNYQHALSLFQKTGGESGQAKAYLGMGNGKYEDAMNNYQHALSLFQKTGGESGQAKAYLGMGNVHWFQGKYEDAMNNYQHALSLFQKTGDECGQANAYLGMGKVQRFQGKYEDAMNNYQHALSLFQKTGDESGQANAYLGDESGQANAYLGMGKVHKSQGKYEDAMNNYQHALSLFQKTGDESGQANAYLGMGKVHRQVTRVVKLMHTWVWVKCTLQGKYEDAMNNYQHALSLFQKTGDESGQDKAYLGMGKVHRSQGKYEDALNNYQHALSLFQKTGDESCQAKAYLGMGKTGDVSGQDKAYLGIGKVHRSQGKYEDTLNNYQHTLSLFQKTGDESCQAKAYLGMGKVHRSHGKYEDAMNNYQQALSLFQKTGDESGQAKAYLVHFNQGKYEDALNNYQHALSLFQKTGDESGQANAYLGMGNVHRSHGKYEDAMNNYQHALSLFQKTGNQGKYEDTLNNYQHALSLFQKTGDVSGQDKAYLGIGKVHRSQGKYEDALNNYQHALSLFQKTDDECGQAKAYLGMGGVHKSQGKYEDAINNCQRALSLFKKTGDESGQAMAYLGMGNVHRSQGNSHGKYEDAMNNYQHAHSLLQKTGDESGQANAYLGMGEMYMSQAKYEDAMNNYQHALSLFQKTGYRQVVCMGQFEDAESYLLKSFICYEQIFTNLGKLEEAKTNIVDTYIEAYHWLVSVSVVLGKKSQALLVSEQGRSRALSENLQTKYGLQGDETKSSLDQEVCLLVSGTSPSFVVVSLSDKYLYLFTLSSLTPLVVHPAAMQMTDEAEQWLSLLKYLINRVICDVNRHVRQNRDDTFEDRSLDLDYDDESEQQHVLTELARVTLGSKGSEKTNEIGGESSGNRKDKSVAKMWGGDSECHLATRSPLPHTTGKPKASDEGTSGKVPQEHDEDVCTPLPKSSAETQRGSGLLKELYRILIEPIEMELTQDEVVRQTGDSFLRKKAIRFGPSLTTLKLLRECPEDKHCKRGVLVVANPRSNANVFTRRNGADVVKSFHERFSNLPAASKEAIMISEILPDVTCLIEYQATKNALMQSLEKAVGVVHIASHGDSKTGEILVVPEPRMDKHDIAEKEEYLLTMNEISSCQINASLVVLGCCHSGRGQIRAEGVMGLARAFLAAGARSLLATLWTIGDNATLEFMERFYRHLASGLSTSASLKRTIRDTISINDKYSHPYYWGAFVLVGDDVTIR